MAFFSPFFYCVAQIKISHSIAGLSTNIDKWSRSLLEVFCTLCCVASKIKQQKAKFQKILYCHKFIYLVPLNHFWYLHQLLSAQLMLIHSADLSPNCSSVRHLMWRWWCHIFWDVPVCRAWPIISLADRSWTEPRGGGILIHQPMHCQAVINLHAGPKLWY